MNNITPETLSILPEVDPAAESGVFGWGYDRDNPSKLVRFPAFSPSTNLVLYNARTGTSETLSLADTNGVSMNNAGASVLTIPLNSTVAFPVGQMIPVLQLGAGQVTVSPVSGSVTLQSRGAAYKLAGQYAQAVLVQTATNVWNLSGDITT